MKTEKKHRIQINRIKEKLILAKEKDSEFKTFGSSFHRYEVFPVKNVLEFEKKFSMKLPTNYQDLIEEIGCGAGPYYGLYDMGTILTSDKSVASPCILFSKEWDYDNWDDNVEKWEDKYEEDYDALYNALFAGTICIGTSGCSGYFGLILNGKHKGRVFEYNTELDYPYLTVEDNFLDWYENWLEDIISGRALKDRATFGRRKPSINPFKDILKQKDIAKLKNQLTDIDALETISQSQIEILVSLYHLQKDFSIRISLLNTLAVFSYDACKPLIKEIISDFDNELYSDVLSIINHSMQSYINEWIPLILPRLEKEFESDLFRTINYILASSNYDYSKEIIPFCNHKDSEIQNISFYSLGQITNKKRELKRTIKNALIREGTNITIIQSIDKGMNDITMVPYYLIALANNRNKEHILINIVNKLDAIGVASFTKLIQEEIIQHISIAKDIYAVNSVLGVLESYDLMDVIIRTTKHDNAIIADFAKGMYCLNNMKILSKTNFKSWLVEYSFKIEYFNLLDQALLFQLDKPYEIQNYKINFLHLIVSKGLISIFYSGFKERLQEILKEELSTLDCNSEFAKSIQEAVAFLEKPY